LADPTTFSATVSRSFTAGVSIRAP
jgi:hypothetical protein